MLGDEITEDNQDVRDSLEEQSEYIFRVEYSTEDKCYLASFAELPSIKCHGPTKVDALLEIMSVVKAVCEKP